MRRSVLLSLAPALAGALSAQSNVVPGLDGRLTVVDSLSYYGRRGAAYPNGEIGMAMLNEMCNPGLVQIPWHAAMQPDHPKFGFLIVRVANDRLEQISDRSFCKHAFTSTNYTASCGPCQSTGGLGGTVMGIGCSDTYGAGNNADRQWLGPADEIDPWLGTWNPVGSYFDQGDPNVGPPQNNDGIRSPWYTGTDQVKNRVTVKEQDLLTANAQYFYGIHLLHQGEAIGNRGDNLASRGFDPVYGGSTWSLGNNAQGQVYGSILQHWSGASVDVGQNGNDDGRFFVAVKVTALGSSNFHYEYAVHNADNSRGAATFRVPIAAASTASNFTFRDIDSNLLNEWTAARVGNEIVFSAPATNPLNWNTIYNFGFDVDRAPGSGAVALDEARIGSGALFVTVPSSVPDGVPSAVASAFGTNCGTATCQPSFYEFFAGTAMDLANHGMTLTPNSGFYAVGTGTGAMVPAAGTNLNLGDDGEATVTLPFALPVPGGATTTTLVVCSNGFVSPASNGTSYTPGAVEFLTGGPRWAAFWADLNPNAGGQVLYESTPSSARVTWSNVPFYNSTNLVNVQMQFEPSGTVHVYWGSLATNGHDKLVGWTVGNGATDPGSTDLTVALPTGFSLCAGPYSGLVFQASARPIFGTTIQLVTSNIPSGTGFGAVLQGLQQYAPPLDLSNYGMAGCQGYVQNGVSVVFVAPGLSVAIPLQVPNNLAFAGLPIYAQSFTYSPPRTALGVIASNGLALILGAQ